MISNGEAFAYKFKVQYDGSHYLGWQVQKKRELSIQGQINMALEKIAKSQNIKTIGAGRTDAGVHALGQVFKATLPIKLPLSALKNGVNSQLPSDIRIVDVEKCGVEFNPILDAKYKEYRYFFSTEEVSHPMWNRYIAHCPKGHYSFDLMKQACSLFEGTHDFNNFYCKGTPVKTTERRIFHCRIFKLIEKVPFIPLWPDCYVVQVQGEGFLKQMVRLMVGTLWKIGEGKLSLEQLEKALKGKIQKEKKLGIVAPPEGLYLQKVVY